MLKIIICSHGNCVTHARDLKATGFVRARVEIITSMENSNIQIRKALIIEYTFKRFLRNSQTLIQSNAYLISKLETSRASEN